MNLLLGRIGHLLVIIAFVSALIATISFFLNVKQRNKSTIWSKYASGAFYIHSLAIAGVFIFLFSIIRGHHFEYHYAWNYTSKILPIYYQISSFWNGQEGSFLLWTGWNALLGIVILSTNKFWKSPVMTWISLGQVFLCSMVLGVVVFDMKIGSSPFMLLREVIQDTIFSLNPQFIPQDGNGLNPLLQNYWMVIHPPTLFLGFASTVVPFAYALSGLWLGQYKEWIRPALPWTIFTLITLGTGILMGAYWAYETLNFGGYWNWDPVENAIYVPWLILVAALHTMIVYKKSGRALLASFFLIIISYLLILYSTFLTRSGILGSASVHSFTDLGLSGQLLFYLLFFVVLSFLMIIYRWKKIPSASEDISMYSREFWIFTGAITLCLTAFQVIIPTSFPVFNSIAEAFGQDLNLAPPADQIGYYSKYQVWFAIGIAILSGIGQFFWWQKMDMQQLKSSLQWPVAISLVITTIFFLIFKINNPVYLLLLAASLFTIVANIKIIGRLKKESIKLSGGALTHIGMGLMLAGILFSSGYDKILSKNNTGMIWSREFPDEINLNNLLLFINEPREMGDYTISYKGMRRLTKSHGYLDAQKLAITQDPLKLVVTEEIKTKKESLAIGTEVDITSPENSYFEVEYKNKKGKSFVLFPRVQLNATMGVVYSPDILRTTLFDIYTHVRTFPDPKEEQKWSEPKNYKVGISDTFFINDYVAIFKGVEKLNSINGVLISGNDAAVNAIIEIQDHHETVIAKPTYIIKDQMAGKIPYEVYEVAAKITIDQIIPEENAFVFSIETSQKDWIIIEAVQKPLINILWLGTFLLVGGMTIAIWRRYEEFVTFREKGMEST